MTLIEILKAQGLTDEQIKAVTDDMKKNKIFTAGEENLDIRYSKLKTDHDALTAQHAESTKLIETLKAGTKDSEAMQGKITAYETQVAQLQDELKKTQVEAAVKVALLAARAVDVDYMTYKLKEKGELELDEQGHIKGIEDKLAGLKTQFPAMFENGDGKGKQIDTIPLPDANNQRKTEPTSLAEALKQQYETNN